MKLFWIIIPGITILFMCSHPAEAQIFGEPSSSNYDTSYIKVYKDELTTRLYFSRKQNGYHLTERLLQPWLNYKTNDNVLIGLGYTYSFLTINLAVKMPFVNDDNDVYGETKYTDLTTHFMFRNYIVDLYLQWNSGYYLSNPNDVFQTTRAANDYPLRGDMRTTLIGINVQHLFNSERYSYKAAFWQNEFQKRSAGSPLIGIEAYWMLGMTDSSMSTGDIPPSGFIDDQPFNQTDISNIGLNGGYAYTFVWDEKLYVSLSTVFGLSGGINKVHYTANSITHSSGITAGLTNSTSISLGFNSSSYYVGLSLVSFTMSNFIGNHKDWITYRTGNIRLNFVKRFHLKKPIKILRPDLWIF